jgi:hypothetical protein
MEKQNEVTEFSSEQQMMANRTSSSRSINFRKSQNFKISHWLMSSDGAIISISLGTIQRCLRSAL